MAAVYMPPSRRRANPHGYAACANQVTLRDDPSQSAHLDEPYNNTGGVDVRNVRRLLGRQRCATCCLQLGTLSTLPLVENRPLVRGTAF